MPDMIGLDFETYGAVDLTVHGLARYVDDPASHFQPLLVGMDVREPCSPAHWIPNSYTDLTQMSVKQARELLGDSIGNNLIVAHNAGFEKKVLDWYSLSYPATRFIDSATVARACGYAGKLEAAAPQMLNMDKMEDGKHLIKLFSIPGKYQTPENMRFNPEIIAEFLEKWELFGKYCALDAHLGLRIAQEGLTELSSSERLYNAITMEMNERGWPVDLALVQEMQRRYEENKVQTLEGFRADCFAEELNLNSLKQMKAWCEDRGIKATSFDEKHVAKLKDKIRARLIDRNRPLDPETHTKYSEVFQLLHTKQILGGSSLKKLQTIIDTASPDYENPQLYRVKDQYVHCGAAQTLRTSGRSIQMQNLKRLGVNILDMDELQDEDVQIDNEELARNIRQVFTASDTHGALIVGDFSSVESRGLGLVAGEEWKTEAYRQGLDLYKVQAAKIFRTLYEDVTGPQRQTGKVGELSCGYGAGAGAVQSFAEGMGIKMTEADAGALVFDWRSANPKTVEFWSLLNALMEKAIAYPNQHQTAPIGGGLMVEMLAKAAPASLQSIHAGVTSLYMRIYAKDILVLQRVFHGAHFRGRDVVYYKPSTLKSGDLWKNHYIHPKTKQLTFYKLYGGKLTGILVQSLCREIFFYVLSEIDSWLKSTRQIQLIGQFHDEIVLDWKPGALSLEGAEAELRRIMSTPPPWLSTFPLEAEIKHAYRYTK